MPVTFESGAAVGVNQVAGVLGDYAAGDGGAVHLGYELGDIRRYGASLTASAAVNTSALAFAAGASNLVFVRQGGYALEAATVPAGVVLKFENGGWLNVGAGQQVTINGSIEAQRYRIFGGAGTVAFGHEQTTFYPEWFGVVRDDGTAAWGDAAALAALKILADANDTAMRKLAAALPGEGSIDLFQLRRQKSITFAPGHYTFRGLTTFTNRRVSLIPAAGGAHWSSVIRTYSNAADVGGTTKNPVWHIAGNPGTPPLYQDVAGEFTVQGLAFEAAPHFTEVEPVLQVGGKNTAGVFSAQGASPVTGVNIVDCSFGQVFAPVRFTYCGQCKFVGNLLDGGVEGVKYGHGVQELRIAGNRFHGTVGCPLEGYMFGALTDATGGALTNCRWIRFVDNECSGYMDYATRAGGQDGAVRIQNDVGNMNYNVRVHGNQFVGIGNIQQAHFAAPKSAVVYADFVTGLFVTDNHFEEFLTPTLAGAPTALTHWPVLFHVAGVGSDRVYESGNTWNVSRDATAVAAGTPWYSLPSSVLNTNIPETLTVTLANNATFDLPGAFKFGSCEILDLNTGEIALFQVSAVVVASPQSIVKQTAALFSIVLTTAAKVNFQYFAAAQQMRLENKTGGARPLRLKVLYNQVRGDGVGV